MDSSPAIDPQPPARTATSTMLAGIVLIVGAIVFLWYAPDSYNIYKALHVVAILVWVGGDVTLTTLGIVFERRRDDGALAELGKMGGWIGTRVYTPGAVRRVRVRRRTDREGRPRLECVLDRLRTRRLGRRHGGRPLLRRTGARPDRRAGAEARAGVAGSRTSREAALHRLPVRHGAARPHRDRHDREAVLLRWPATTFPS